MSMDAVILNIEEKFSGAVTAKVPDGITIKKESLREVFQFLKDGPWVFESLHSVTAVDRKDRIEMVYHVFSFQHKLMLTVKADLPSVDPEIDSLTHLWQSADWFEREVYDLFGVKFVGHPDLRRILNPEEWTAFPLRKDFKMDGVIPKPVK